METSDRISKLKYYPLTVKRWNDFEKLFGEKGACGGCWCMWWRLKRSEFEKKKGAGNKRAMKKLVNSGVIPGIIIYNHKLPIAWCSVAPRNNFQVLDHSRILKRVDDKPVWSIVCFFISKEYRNTGLSMQILKSVIEFCKSKGAKIIEGYPIQPKKPEMPSVFAWTGFYSAFKKAGFKEVERRSETRPIMRFNIT